MTPTASLAVSATPTADVLSGGGGFNWWESSSIDSRGEAQSLQMQSESESANLEFYGFRNCGGGFCPPPDYWERPAETESSGNGLLTPGGSIASKLPGDPAYNGALPLEVDAELQLDDVYTVIGLAAEFHFSMSPSNQAVDHEIQIIFKDNNGDPLFSSSVCQWTPTSPLPEMDTLCPDWDWLEDLTISDVKSVMFIYRTSVPLGNGSGSYVIYWQNLRIRVDELIEAPVTPTPTPTPTLTATPYPQSSPEPLTGQLAFAAIPTDSDFTDIYVMVDTTDNRLRLSNDVDIDQNPALSPDGSQVAFVSNRDGDKEIYVKPVADGVDDTNLLQLTSNSSLEDNYPTWSPDGTQIAYVGTVNFIEGVWIVNADGSGTPELKLIGNYYKDLAWSPDGTQLLFAQFNFEDDSNDIYIMDLDPIDEPVLVIGSSEDDRFPSWSSDGGHIVFSSKQPVDENDSGPNYNIFIANADGTDIDTVTTDHVHDNIHPTFLSGGAEVAFTSYYPTYDEDPFATFANIAFKIYRNSAAGAPAFSSASMGVFSFGDWEQSAEYNGIHEPQQVAMALVQVEPPSNFCISRLIVDDPDLPGLNIRSAPQWGDNKTEVRGGTLRITGYYRDSQGRWLRVDPYIDGDNVNTSLIGWVWEDAFQNPCADSSSVETLPVMDSSGSVIALPTPVPPPTPIAPAPTPEYPTASCEGIFTNNPTNMHYAWYEASPLVQILDTWAQVDIYAQTDGGSEYNGSTIWYQVIFNSVTGESSIGWIHQAFLDSHQLATLCGDVPLVFRPTPTPQPTLTPTPSPTPPPDLSSVFPLPMVGSGGEPARLTNAGCQLEYLYSIPSRDLNPLNRNDAGHPLYSSASSSVIVTDRDGGGPAGVFVSIRIPMENVPFEIRQRLATLNEVPGDDRFGNISLDAGGSLHIGYSHIQENTIPSPIEPVSASDGIQLSELILTGSQLGNSGDTGNTFGPHLDIAVFYSPDDGTMPGPLDATHFETYGDQAYFADFRHNWVAFWTMYDEASRKPNLFGHPIVVNPLVLWPILQEGTGCSFY